MPVGWAGQMITFGSEVDPDENYSRYVYVRATKADNTIKKIAARRGHPEWAGEILKLNKGRDVLPHPKPQRRHTGTHSPGKGWVGVGGGWWIKRPAHVSRLRTVHDKLRVGASIKLPGTMKQGFFFNVHADDKPPRITSGYAKYSIENVPGRRGINKFDGYDPIVMEVPVQFENYSHFRNDSGQGIGHGIESDIQMLERMAGRGDYPGAAIGPPAVIRVSTTDSDGNMVPLIPPNYQWTPTHTNAPLWRITDISWDDTAVERNTDGYRVRQKAVITLTQYTPLVFIQRSVTQRAKAKPKPKKKVKARKHV